MKDKEPLTDADIERMERSIGDAAFGFNTNDLQRRYAKDVRRLIDERHELLKELQELRKRVAPSTRP